MIIGRLSVRSEERRDLRKKNRQEAPDRVRRASREYYDLPRLLFKVFIYSNPKGGAKDLFIMILRTK